METVTRKTIKYTWDNHLSQTDKYHIAFLYLDGYAIYNIANTFRVTPSTIQYHLQIMGVYVRNKRPTNWNKQISKHNIESSFRLTDVISSSTVPSKILPVRDRLVIEDYKDARYEFNKPAKYKDILAKQQKIRQTFKRNDIADNRYNIDSLPFKPMLSIML